MKQKARSIIITVLAMMFGLAIAVMLVSWLLAYLFPATSGIGAHTGGFSISIVRFPLSPIRAIGAALIFLLLSVLLLVRFLKNRRA